MTHPFLSLWEQPSRLVVGLMSGTSADGVDAVLTRITGFGLDTKVSWASSSSPLTMIPASGFSPYAAAMLAAAGSCACWEPTWEDSMPKPSGSF